LIGLPWAREFARRYRREFSDFIEFPGCPGLPERAPDPVNVQAFLACMRHAAFDLVIQMHGSGRFINAFVQQFSAKAIAGYFSPESDSDDDTAENECPDDDTFLRYPSNLHEAHRHLRLIEFLSGTHSSNVALDWPLTEDDLNEAAELLGGARPICLHPGARYMSRRWPVERFAEVGNRLGQEGWPIVITGSAEEEELGQQLSDALTVPHRRLSGMTSLGGMFGVAARSRLIITNDTGMSHVAASVRAPSVVLHLGSDAHRWAPLDAQRHLLVSAPVECRPCDHRICPIGHACAYDLSSDVVLAAAHRQLQRFPAPHQHCHVHPARVRK
jgi:ADP-heptose:LPS heptosyltransferase